MLLSVFSDSFSGNIILVSGTRVPAAEQKKTPEVRNMKNVKLGRRILEGAGVFVVLLFISAAESIADLLLM